MLQRQKKKYFLELGKELHHEEPVQVKHLETRIQPLISFHQSNFFNDNIS